MFMSEQFRFLIAPLLGIAVVVVGLLFFLAPQAADDEIQEISFLPGDLTFVVGSGEQVDGKVLVNGFRDGYSVLSSGPVTLPSEHLLLLQLDINAGETSLWVEQAPAFFWRQKSQPELVSRLTLDNSGFVDLGKEENWEGEITEIGFLFQETSKQHFALGAISFQAPSTRSNIDLTLKEWFQFEPWTQRSINFLYGGTAQQGAALPLILLIWVLATIFIFWLASKRSSKGLARYGFAIALLAWMALDVRWTVNGAKQAGDSISKRWVLSDHDRMLNGLDAELYTMISRFKGKMSTGKTHRVIIVGDNSRFPYYLARAKYHLLPDGAVIRERLSEKIDPLITDYVLFIDDFASKGTRWNDIWLQLPMHDTWRDSLQLADSGELGILFSVVKTKNDQ